LENNTASNIEGLRQSLEAQYEFLYQTSTYLDRTLQFGDSYALDTKRDFEIVKSISGITVSGVKKSVAYPCSKFAVLRKGELELFVDAMPQTASHQHTGRPNIAVYWKGIPVIADSGACNYDRRNFRMYLRACSAHNAVYSDILDKEDVWNIREFIQETHTFSEITGEQCKVLTIESTISYEDICYHVTRTIEVGTDHFSIRDKAHSDTPQQFRLRLHLAGLRVEDTPTKIRQLADNVIFNIQCPEHTLELCPYVTAENEPGIAHVVCAAQNGNDFESEFFFTIE